MTVGSFFKLPREHIHNGIEAVPGVHEAWVCKKVAKKAEEVMGTAVVMATRKGVIVSFILPLRHAHVVTGHSVSSSCWSLTLRAFGQFYCMVLLKIPFWGGAIANSAM